MSDHLVIIMKLAHFSLPYYDFCLKIIAIYRSTKKKAYCRKIHLPSGKVPNKMYFAVYNESTFTSAVSRAKMFLIKKIIYSLSLFYSPTRAGYFSKYILCIYIQVVRSDKERSHIIT